MVSLRLRQAVPLLVLATVFVATGVHRYRDVRAAASTEPAGRAPKPFPAHVVPAAPGLPQYADGPRTRIRQQVASANAMWTTTFAAGGETYERPDVADGVPSTCRPTGGWAGVYCGEDSTIVIDVDAHLARHSAVGGGLSDLALGYIVAHEVGHHVQRLRGATAPADIAGAQRIELHADCLAGVWGKAAGLPLPPTWIYGSDAQHGSAQKRVEALNVGYRSGRPADCDVIWSGA